MASKITLFHQSAPQPFVDVTSLAVEDGVLTFYWKASPQASKKITTNVPFVVEEDVS